MNAGFADRDSMIHRTAPVVRVVAAFGLSLVTALAMTPTVPLVALGLGVVFVGMARLPVTGVLKGLLPLLFFLLILWLVLPFTGEGATGYTWGPLTIKEQGVRLALLVSIKSGSILLILMALVSTMHSFDLGYALNALGLPEKLTFLIVMSARYIAVIEREYRKLSNAAKIRGFQPNTSLHAYRTYAHMAGMLLVRSHLRAGRVYNAMVLRGFDGRFKMMGSERAIYPNGALPQAVGMGLCVVVLMGLEVAVRLGVV